MALEGLSRGIFRSLGFLRSKRRLNEEELKEMTKSLRRALQEADFNVRQTKEIVDRLEERMREEEPRPGLDLQTHAMNILYLELVRLLGSNHEFQPRGATLLSRRSLRSRKDNNNGKVGRVVSKETRSACSSYRG